MRCPGQDKRYWTGEVAFDVACPKCGSAVEFFKDESSGRCPSCGHRFRNPQVSFDCAQWCSYAEECLGFVPERKVSPADPGGGALASRLIQAVKEEYAADQTRLTRALSTFQYARELLSAEGGDPRIVLGAALLLEIGRDEHGDEDSTEETSRILKDIGLDSDTIVCICRVLDQFRRDQDLDTVEAKVVADSHLLAKLASARADGTHSSVADAVKPKLRTEAGRRKAQTLC